MVPGVALALGHVDVQAAVARLGNLCSAQVKPRQGERTFEFQLTVKAIGAIPFHVEHCKVWTSAEDGGAVGWATLCTRLHKQKQVRHICDSMGAYQVHQSW